MLQIHTIQEITTQVMVAIVTWLFNQERKQTLEIGTAFEWTAVENRMIYRGIYPPPIHDCYMRAYYRIFINI